MRPRRARDVLAARNPSVVQPSSIGSSGRPTPRIWKKWSMTQIESNPTSSAWRATRARVGPTADAPPGHVYEGICKPIFIELGLRARDWASPWASGPAPVIEALVAGCYSHPVAGAVEPVPSRAAPSGVFPCDRDPSRAWQPATRWPSVGAKDESRQLLSD